MPDNYRTISTSAQSFDVEILDSDGSYQKNIVLSVSPAGNTRKSLRAIIVRNATAPDHRCKVTVVHQRKNREDLWEDVESINLSRLLAGEGVKFELNAQTTYTLYEHLKDIYEIAESDNLGFGTHELVVGRAEEIVSTTESRATVIREIINSGYSEEVWNDLVAQNPNLAQRLSIAKIVQARRLELDVFESMLTEDHNESTWQNFFSKNTWIFGYGLKYVFLNTINTQPGYGGGAVTRQGHQQGDFLTSTTGSVKFTVLVEIKKPQTQLVLNTENRAGCNRLSSDLLDGTNQVQVNCSTWATDGSRSQENRQELDDVGIYTHNPKGILIIGNTSQLDNLNKRRAFENFRSNLNTPEIITFDELCARAKYIVELEEDQVSTDTDTTSDQMAEE